MLRNFLTFSCSAVKFPDLRSINSQSGGLEALHHVCELRASEVEAYCRSDGATIQAVGQAVWALLLSAYTGEANITFGTIFSGRTGSENQKTAFPSISTIPVPSVADQPVDALVRAMVDYNAAAYRHRFTPLSDIQKFAGSDASSLFDTVFVYQKASTPADAGFNWPLIRETASVDYAVSVEMEMHPDDSILLRLTFDTIRLPDTHADLLLRQFEHIMRNLVIKRRDRSDLSRDIYSIVLPKHAELPSSSRFLHDFVSQGAANHPDKVALHFVHGLNKDQTRRWTYRELNERANQVAHLLKRHSVKPRSIVAVRMDKCAEASFAFIGILKAGCAFLALDPALPSARQEFILQDSGASMLLISGEQTDVSHFQGCSTITFQEDTIRRLPQRDVEDPRLDADATCYCLYTSGTTGLPKGCEITHENAVQAMLAFQQLFAGHWDANSRWLQFASYWFDVSVLEQFWSWSVGIAVVGAPRDVVLDDLAGFIQQLQITHIDLTPSLARILHPSDVPSLHKGVFITGGEALKQEIIDMWGPIKAICNGYGPTEATIGVTMNPFLDGNAKPSNIGPPFLNVGAYVFTPGSDEPVLRGAVGELCVTGKLVGKGYLNRAELTAKSFPAIERYGERFYRTGDLVRLLADGSVSFIGRKDTQAKLRGQRLEIGEIDSVIKGAANSINEVSSLVVRDEAGVKEQLVSFLTNGPAKNGPGLNIDDSGLGRGLVAAADQACRDRLPGYMVPTHIIPLNFFPLTVNNKTDSKSLVALFRGLSTETLQNLKGDDSGSLPLNADERQICSILANLLGIAEASLSRNTNIFSSGLSSVSAIPFAAMLKRHGFKSATTALVMQSKSFPQVYSCR
jgi:ferricrocin synthase